MGRQGEGVSNLAYALDALRRGFAIFPCEPRAKTPARLYPARPASEAPWIYRWSESATTDINTALRWWNEQPDRNVAIACKPSGLLVVDCDVSASADGYLEWVDLACQYDPEWYDPPTLTVRTGGGGLHLFYRWPSHVQASQSGISAHVDIRSNGGEKGGYVLAAGSITSKGAYAVEDDYPIATAPPWLVELCRERPRQVRQALKFAQPGALSFSGLQTAVATAAEGNRNNVLLWAARSMVEDGADEQTIIDTLLDPAMGAGLAERDVRATIRSAYRLQSGKV